MLAAVFICTAGCCGVTTGKTGGAVRSQEIKFITLAGLQASLPANHILVGFDIDDTVLFSSPGFYYGMNNTDGPNGANRYGDSALKNPQFWRDLNQIHDKYSLPKKAGRDLVGLHNKRGDGIVFITARDCYDNDAEVLQKRLNAIFGLAGSKVICTNEQSKAPSIEESGLDMYYGDADSDIRYSLDVKGRKVRPIRVLRSPLSTNQGGNHPGMYDEEVLSNSEN